MAVSWIEICSDDELIDYLPQLVQVSNNTKMFPYIYSSPGFFFFFAPHLQQNIFVICHCLFNNADKHFFPTLKALKFESHLKNALVMFLFSRAQGNVNIAHQLYWLILNC